MGFRGSPMEACSSGEELTVKARKPYTITKQRERWTDEEHNRFLEALKLYGRAWQRIEEHIGTKTAVQIRSHAQKFFSKLEKEASSKGIPLGQTLDIDIPPPRPKRKPSNPYPRKTCVGTIPSLKERNGKSLSPTTTSACQNKALHLKSCPQLEKIAGVESLERVEDISDNGNCSEVLNLSQDAPCVSMSPAKKSYATPPSFRKFVPFSKYINHKPENEDASTTNQKKELTQCTTNCADMDIHQFKGLDINSQAKEAPMKMSPDHKRSQEVGITSNCDLQSTRNNANHVAFHPVEANNEKSGHFTNCNPSNMTCMPNQAEIPVYPAPPFNNPSLSAKPEHSTHPVLSSVHTELPNFPPFTPFCNNQEAYRSLFNVSSTFSNFIMSCLLQNPAAHAAACLAASFWPSVDGQTINSVPEALLNCGAPTGQVNTFPNMAAIAGSTVAAATAWWETHGSSLFCHPLLSTGFSFAPTHLTCPTMNNQQPEASEARLDDHAQPQRVQDEHILDPESPDDLVMQRFSSKSLQLTSSDSNESGRGGRTGTELNGSDDKDLNLAHDCIFHDHGDKSKIEKNIDSCSCGSNKSSSNENVTKDVLQKDLEDKEKVKQTSVSETNKEKGKRASFVGSNFRRYRCSGSSSESWKEVSEEGRLAFQALFSMEILPQSFSPPAIEDGAINLDERIPSPLPIKPKSNICEDIVLDRIPSLESSSSRNDNHSDKSVLTSESEYVKLKSNRTGFKPYKRCSMEVKEARTSVADESSNKRSRMEGKASIR